MNYLTGILHLITGLAYTGVGILAAIDVYRLFRITRTYDWLGTGLVIVASACGPHHLDVGYHILVSGHPAVIGDLTTIAVAMPFGVIWVLLRLEQFFHRGSGDRVYEGHPRWATFLLPIFALNLGVALGVGVGWIADSDTVTLSQAWPQIVVACFYLLVAWWLLSTQWAVRERGGGWSLSGLSFAGVFATCATSHLVYGLAVSRGAYPQHSHLFWLNVYGVAAAAFWCAIVYQQRRKVSL